MKMRGLLAKARDRIGRTFSKQPKYDGHTDAVHDFQNYYRENYTGFLVMAISIDGPRDEMVLLHPEPLCHESFSSFGRVIENPSPSLIPSSRISPPPGAILANQDSALKFGHVTDLTNLYEAAPSQKRSEVVMSMFVCSPRALNADGHFLIQILERHPYTTQTFIPLGLPGSHTTSPSQYIVIVAPSLPPSSSDEGLPVPDSVQPGLPNLSRIKAFLAHGSQAVTYGAGVWHAPMVVVGCRPIDFIVVQFANGVALEDCQEAEVKMTGRGGIWMAISSDAVTRPGMSKL